MFKKILPLLLLSATLFSSHILAATNSAGGIISVAGAISDTTCKINGGDSANFTILLDPISVSDAGTTAYTVVAKNQKAFKLTFSDCAPAGSSGSNLKFNFSSPSSISTDGQYLVNDTVDENNPNVAKNVGFSLSAPNAKTTAIPLNTPYDTGLKGDKTAPQADELTFVVSYYKTRAEPAKAGPLHANLIYTISYL
ncbi:fimbrial protein [Arsenophonus sp. aPb]|uniref:fimbrial protein n=1 Tax=Arsenophonus sp. aPb TaxID=3041619 RepID=UPI002469A7EB|nr:fimbrial protein [Arsenophonus sp. aPb]WGL98304.1 fimbrial protein [Arsenophonus sp. aPb]